MDVLRRAGIPLAPPVPLLIDHAHLGRGYAEPTKESLAACEAAGAAGVPLEPVYTGKALAALRADAREAKLRNVVFWSTVRRDPIPHADGWRARLPPLLARALEDPPAFSGR
jgi:D-cysteine desulfhydrase